MLKATAKRNKTRSSKLPIYDNDLHYFKNTTEQIAYESPNILHLLIRTVTSINLKERKKLLRNVGVDERIILKCIIRGSVVNIATRLRVVRFRV